jgi:hypothetical protein
LLGPRSRCRRWSHRLQSPAPRHPRASLTRADALMASDTDLCQADPDCRLVARVDEEQDLLALALADQGGPWRAPPGNSRSRMLGSRTGPRRSERREWSGRRRTRSFRCPSARGGIRAGARAFLDAGVLGLRLTRVCLGEMLAASIPTLAEGGHHGGRLGFARLPRTRRRFSRGGSGAAP